MSYRGRELTSGNYLKLDDISSQFNSSTTTFNLTSGGNLFYPGSAFSLLVVLGGVVQEPESAYTINQYQITFASAPGASDDFFCIVMGVALGIGVPGEGTVSGSKLTKPFNYDSGLLYLDDTNNRVGINTLSPQAPLHLVGSGSTTLLVDGSINATSYYGDGSGLDGVSGLGTALSQTLTSPLSKIYYVDNILSIDSTITVDAPDTATLSPGGFRVAYTNYADIFVADTMDLIVSDGDELILDVLALS